MSQNWPNMWKTKVMLFKIMALYGARGMVLDRWTQTDRWFEKYLIASSWSYLAYNSSLWSLIAINLNVDRYEE